MSQKDASSKGGKENFRKIPSDSEEFSNEEPSERHRSKDDYNLRNVFSRPLRAEPKHPLFSSLYVRHIALKAFGPKKPKWYTPLSSAQLYLFKDILNFVDIGRTGLFRFDDFMEALQDFDPGITRAEVLDLLYEMEGSEFEEVDFGKFLFLLAYRDQASNGNEKENIKRALSSPVVTYRQCLLLSAMAYYILIASPEEITRYYISNTRRKATVLHFHMEAARLLGLTEKQMEGKQRKAMRHLDPLFAVTGSPYACPVPFVACTENDKTYRKWTDRKFSCPRTALPMKKKPIQRPIMPIKQDRKLGDPVAYETEDDETFYDMHYGRIPMPQLGIPEKIRDEILKKCTVAHKKYITNKAYEALNEYRERLKKATVLYNNRSLDVILKKGFPTYSEEKAFIKVFERYMPLTLDDAKNFSSWVKPADYERKHAKKSLHPDKFAFGSKIP